MEDFQSLVTGVSVTSTIVNHQRALQYSSTMRIGFSLPQYGAMAEQATSVAQFAQTIELAGAESLWVGDRALAPTSPTLGFAKTGPAPFPSQFRKVLDPFGLLTVAALSTTRVRLGTSVLNAPWYQPLLLARSLTTIELLSQGRLVPGFGSGWSPDEFGALGVPFSGRGARLDEVLDVLDAVWTTDITEHAGPLWTVPPSYFDLAPAQHPRPPVYLGGFSPAALARVGRRADGWLPSVRLPDGARADELSDMLAIIRRAAEQAGRSPDEIDVILRVDVHPGVQPAQILDLLAAVEERTGISHAFIELLLLARDSTEAMDIAADLLKSANHEDTRMEMR